MIVVSGVLKFNPDKHDEFAEAAIKMSAASNAEAGVSAYGFYADPSERGVFRVFEEYVDDDALASHSSSPHMAEFMGAVGGVGFTEFSLHKYDVNEKSKLM
ncbi:MAG TPA: putative quinol monooxygenase [Acidimicrobiales bacterium]|nr:putative quinol monooxygenase [Acidimicrobiales bacterium]